MPTPDPIPSLAGGSLARRHRLSTRIWHWINAVTVLVMLMSGLMIFNAHPRLYGGAFGANADPAWFSMGSDATRGFVIVGDWRLVVDGLVRKPLALSLADLRGLPSRTQITRHDCVEGWSAIGKWQGVPLGMLLQGAGLSSEARFLVLHCADDFSGTAYYESIDLIDAFHPQTILAWSLNDQPLPVANGAPLRLRVERQLGYKHAKYVMRVEAVDSLRRFGLGKGGDWEDQVNYEWYAGI